MNRNIVAQPSPIVIQEKSRENQSKDLAAIIQAASKTNSVLSSVWLKRRENHFRMEFVHVGVSGLVSGIVVGVCAYLLGASADVAIGLALSSIILSAVAIVLLVFRNADTLEYEVEYESTSQQAASTQKVTYRIELERKNRLTFVNLPDWFGQKNLNALMAMHNKNIVFNARNLPLHGVCKQQQVAELRDDLARAQLLAKNGRSWQLTDAFFALAKQEVN